MRGPRPEPLFLARETYRRRRVMDAARVMPFAAAFLFIAPVLWRGGGETGWGVLYLFSAWLLLIAVAALIAGTLARAPDPRPDDQETPRDDGDP